MKIKYKDLEKKLLKKIKEKIKLVLNEDIILEDFSKKKEDGVD